MIVGFASMAIAAILLNIIAARLGFALPGLVTLNVLVNLAVTGIGFFVVVRVAMGAQKTSNRMRQTLTASETRLAAVVDSAMDAIITIDAGQRIVYFNRSAERIFRCKGDTALGTSLDRFLPTRFHDAHRTHVANFGKTGVTNRRMGDATILWARRADSDEEFPIEASISHTSADGVDFFTVILRDVTERHRLEGELKRRQTELQTLSAQIQEARDDEKTLIARELHDELGQQLTALKMDLTWLRDHLPVGNGELVGKAGRMNETLDQTVVSVRRIAADLRPLMLDDLGLLDAAGWLVEEFSQRSGIHCDVQMPATDTVLPDIDRSIANTTYRVLQESLTNVSRHARARNAWVVLAIDADAIRLEVEDDGRGIAPEDLVKRKSLGLKGMRERVLHAGGTLEIGRAPRGGTRIGVCIPLQPKVDGAPS
ncbi:MAG: ATP-binding protein [Burkholderiales bacterium]